MCVDLAALIRVYRIADLLMIILYRFFASLRLPCSVPCLFPGTRPLLGALHEDYLIIIFVGLFVVLILGIMLSAWCCKGSSIQCRRQRHKLNVHLDAGAFQNPLCCPCYLCACCGGLGKLPFSIRTEGARLISISYCLQRAWNVLGVVSARKVLSRLLQTAIEGQLLLRADLCWLSLSVYENKHCSKKSRIMYIVYTP